ncbi:MAG: cyclic pyranopterin monophosphate synthase MoaC [Syntrophales bacterium]|nr:cyclic pyranopterin monophosphate synthase MoaC [Syntrophales bacterium]
MKKLSHLDEKGRARMVDVTAKSPTLRRAVARGTVRMRPETAALIQEGGIPKGDVFAVARIAGIMAAKKTGDLIPMCHPLELTGIEILFSCDTAAGEVSIEATVQTIGRTGVEMEAMTAVSAAGLTIYDMCKAVDREIVITDIRLMSKEGGKSGAFVRQERRGKSLL